MLVSPAAEAEAAALEAAVAPPAAAGRWRTRRLSLVGLWLQVVYSRMNYLGLVRGTVEW